MIYTLTLNPAIDYVAYIDTILTGEINRSYGEKIFFGGKGINVSLVLREFGTDSVAMGFVAGFTGEAIENGLKEKGIGCDFVRLKSGFSRINIKLRSDTETDINAEGPKIGSGDIDALFEKFNVLKDGDTLILAGSIPPSLPQNIYERIIKSQGGKNIRFVVDTAGEKLRSTLKYRPFLIKPNADELSEIFSVRINTPDEAVFYARELQKEGALNVLVSMGEKGAVLLSETGETYFERAYSGNAVNTVGAGDSTVAGFIAGFEKTGNFAHALKLGTAAGSATAFCEGLADINAIKTLLNGDVD